MTQPAHSQYPGLEHRLVKYLNAGFGLKGILQPIRTLQSNLEHLQGFAEVRPSSPSSHSGFSWGRSCQNLPELCVFRTLRLTPMCLKDTLEDRHVQENWKYPFWSFTVPLGSSSPSPQQFCLTLDRTFSKESLGTGEGWSKLGERGTC